RSPGDYWVSKGHHFGRTIYSMCSVLALLQNGLIRLEEMHDEGKDLEEYDEEEIREHRIFRKLLRIPKLKEKLGEDDAEYIMKDIAARGIHSARADDTKSLKSIILDWLMPDNTPIHPPIQRNNKSLRGFNHIITGAYLCLQARIHLTSLSRDPWRCNILSEWERRHPWHDEGHDGLVVLRRHPGMSSLAATSRSCLTPSSFQVHFCLSSASVFSQNDKITDSERFYNSLLNHLDDPAEQKQVSKLMKWWDRQVFPGASTAEKPLPPVSALARFAAYRASQNKHANEHTNISESLPPRSRHVQGLRPTPSDSEDEDEDEDEDEGEGDGWHEGDEDSEGEYPEEGGEGESHELPLVSLAEEP
ncbi:hypothetical protein OF83DRAFT_1066352, partial [Amylostereum chailletii]